MLRSVRALLWATPCVAAGLAVLSLSAAARAKRPAYASPAAGEVVVAAADNAVRAVLEDPTTPPPPAPARCPPEPILPMKAAVIPPPLELAKIIRENPGQLGSASVGFPTKGRLWGGVQLMPSDDIEPAGDQPWGTENVIRSIERAVREVRRCFRDTHKLSVGDISRKEGGFLVPHKSHQSGLDADLGYYYTSGPAWFQHATKDTLDAPRTWRLVRALVDNGNVESIYIDMSIQKLLRAHAETLEGEKPVIDLLFASEENKEGIIRHIRGHTAHLHVRVRHPPAVELGNHMARFMPAQVFKPIPAPKAAPKRGGAKTVAAKPPPPRRPQLGPPKQLPRKGSATAPKAPAKPRK